LGQPVRQASALACEGSVCHPKEERKKERHAYHLKQNKTKEKVKTTELKTAQSQ